MQQIDPELQKRLTATISRFGNAYKRFQMASQETDLALNKLIISLKPREANAAKEEARAVD